MEEVLAALIVLLIIRNTLPRLNVPIGYGLAYTLLNKFSGNSIYGVPIQTGCPQILKVKQRRSRNARCDPIVCHEPS